jgi:acetyl esterase/lipase
MNKKIKTLFVLFICLNVMCQEPIEPDWKDLNYAGNEQGYHTMDIYLPKENKKKYPVVMTIYGSAWGRNDKKGANKRKKEALIKSGFAVVSINHRSSYDAIFPAQIHDVKAAIRFIRGNAKKYTIDTSFFGITGSSSGGHLACLAGTTSFNSSMEGNLGKFLNFSSHVDAVVDFYGPTDFLMMDICGSKMVHDDINSPESRLIGGQIQKNKDKAKAANPVTYISKNTPPFLIIHGMNDLTVPYCQSKILHNILKEKGIKSELITIIDGGHGRNVQVPKVYNKMISFFKTQLNSTINNDY